MENGDAAEVNVCNDARMTTMLAVESARSALCRQIVLG